MNESELSAYLLKNYEEILGSFGDDRKMFFRIEHRNPPYDKFVPLFEGFYVYDIVRDAENWVSQKGKQIKNDLSFYYSKEDKIEYCKSRVLEVKAELNKNEYVDIFNVDRFHEEIFSNYFFEIISVRLYIKKAQEIKTWFQSDQSPDILEEICFDEVENITSGFRKLIEVKLLKYNMQLILDNDIVKSKKRNQLSTNQVVLLLHDLGFVQIIENNPLTVQAKLISKLTGYHEKNIKTSLEKLGKKKSNLPPQQEKDQKKVDDTINELQLILNKEK